MSRNFLGNKSSTKSVSSNSSAQANQRRSSLEKKSSEKQSPYHGKTLSQCIDLLSSSNKKNPPYDALVKQIQEEYKKNENTAKDKTGGLEERIHGLEEDIKNLKQKIVILEEGNLELRGKNAEYVTKEEDYKRIIDQKENEINKARTAHSNELSRLQDDTAKETAKYYQDLHSKQIDGLNRDINKLIQERDEKDKEGQFYKEHYNASKNDFARYKEEFEPIYQERIERLTAESNKYKDEIVPLHINELNELKRSKKEDELSYNRQIQELKNTIERYKSELESSQKGGTDKLNNELYTCQNEIIPKQKQQIDKLSGDLAKYQQQIDKLSGDLAESQQEVTQFCNDIGVLTNELNKYQNEIVPSYINELNDLNELRNYKNNAESYYSGKINELNKELNKYKYHCNKYKSDNDELNKRIKREMDQNTTLKSEVHKVTLYNKELETTNKELEASNEKLRQEASTYQSALGDALNFRLKDEDMNNSVQLSADISSLQDRLDKYVTTLKGNAITVNTEQIRKLYEYYKLDSRDVKDKIQMKVVLQRYVLEKIFESMDSYLTSFSEGDHPDSPYCQEKFIIYHTDALINLLDKFYNSHISHVRQDNVIKAIPTKIRQQVYGILGAFGFSEIYENNNKYPHPFTMFAKQELNQNMSGYRDISDISRKNTVENMAEDLIKDAVTIFKFRLLVQEPKCEVHWFKNNEKIKPQFMKGGQWDDENLDDYVVKICYFPLIGMELYDPSKIKVCTHAKVFPLHITPPSSPSSHNESEETSPKETFFGNIIDKVGNFMGSNKKKNPNASSTTHHDSAENAHDENRNNDQRQLHQNQNQGQALYDSQELRQKMQMDKNFMDKTSGVIVAYNQHSSSNSTNPQV